MFVQTGVELFLKIIIDFPFPTWNLRSTWGLLNSKCSGFLVNAFKMLISNSRMYKQTNINKWTLTKLTNHSLKPKRKSIKFLFEDFWGWRSFHCLIRVHWKQIELLHNTWSDIDSTSKLNDKSHVGDKQNGFLQSWSGWKKAFFRVNSVVFVFAYRFHVYAEIFVSFPK